MEGLLFRGAKVTRGRSLGFVLFGREGVAGSIFLETLAFRNLLTSRHGYRPFAVPQGNVARCHVLGEALWGRERDARAGSLIWLNRET